uniref:Uncharacterized protein n=1 Tax=Arundo donax TaxID=35708 RepID=A0A0A9H1G3_ARUDO
MGGRDASHDAAHALRVRDLAARAVTRRRRGPLRPQPPPHRGIGRSPARRW